MVLALLLAGFGCLFLLNSWSRDFWAPGEVDFALACREMRASGDWLEPSIGGRPYLEKPILVYWLGLASELLTGLDDHVAFRLPIALFGVLGLWVTYYAGRAFFSRNVGVLAMVIHGTTYLCFRTSSWFLTDVVFTSLVSLSMVAFLSRIVWARYSVRWLVVGYGSLALACLAKSPLLAPYFVGVTLLFVLFLQYGLRRVGGEIGRLRILVGAAAVLIVVLPWYAILISRHGGEFLSINFLEHHFDRLYGAESHRQPIWYYLISLPLDFLPWSFFLPLALFYGHARFSRPAEKILVVWAVVVFVTLTLVSSKQGKYLLPMWTPLSVLIAAGFLTAESESIWKNFLGRGVLSLFPWLLRVLALAPLIAAACLLLDAIPERLRQAPFDALITSEGFKTRALVVASLLASALFAGAWFAARELRRRQTMHALYAVCASFALVFLFGTFLYADFNTVKSGRGFAALVEKTVGDQPLAIYAKARPSILVYMADRPVTQLDVLDVTGADPAPQEELARYLDAPGVRFLLMYQKDREKIEGNFPSFARKYQAVASGYVGSRRLYWILKNQ